MESNRRKEEVLSGNASEEIKEKKNAPRPKADRGNAVAVPRRSGQFRAAADVSHCWSWGCRMIYKS